MIEWCTLCDPSSSRATCLYLGALFLIRRTQLKAIDSHSSITNELLIEDEEADQTADGYYVAYKPITLSCILFIEMKFIHCHSCVMFAMKSMSMCND